MRALTIAVALLLVAGCGGDEAGTSGAADLGRDDVRRQLPDAEEDSGGDEPTADTGTDTSGGGDSGSGVEEPAVEANCNNGEDDDGDQLVDCFDVDCEAFCEICNDLMDNNANGRIDCADPQCAANEVCPEFCGNGADDDADTDIDCDDVECATEPRCTEEPTPADSYEFSDRLNYFYVIQYPPAGVACCFDYNDDGRSDNNLTGILNLIPGYDAQANMSGLVNDGDIAVLLEWVSFPEDLGAGGPAGFNVYRAVPVDPPQPVLPDHGGFLPEENRWNDGEGVFQVTRDSFDPLGPRIRFREAEFVAPEREEADALLVAGPSELNITVPIAELGLDLSVTLYGARVEADVVEVTGDGGTSEIRTLPDTAVGTTGTVRVGGGRLGGYVRADDILKFFNDGAAQCECATPPASLGVPMMEFGERLDERTSQVEYNVECRWAPLEAGDVGYSCTSLDSQLCANLKQICAIFPILPGFLDVDINKNQVEEGISAGLFFDFVGADLDDPPIAE